MRNASTHTIAPPVVRRIFEASRAILVTAAMVAVILLGACNDETKPPPGNGLTLANSWPNEDGRTWVYGLAASIWSTQAYTQFPPDVIFDTPAEVPAVPALIDAAALLDVEFTGAPISSESALYTLRFAGMDTTLSGAIGQNLVATVDELPMPTKGAGERSTQPFLARVATIRPDLRARIEARIGHPVMDRIDPLPLFLAEGAWQKTVDWIGRYADLDTELAWLYLEANLATGHSFTLQLIPELADDVFLHGRVQGTVAVETEAGTYEDALEVVYQIDYGVSQVADIDGNVVGYVRTFDLARVIYAAGVGPVGSEERVLYAVTQGMPMGPWATLELSLQSTGRPEPLN